MSSQQQNIFHRNVFNRLLVFYSFASILTPTKCTIMCASLLRLLLNVIVPVSRLVQTIVSGFAGATADALTLRERLERKLEEYPGELMQWACIVNGMPAQEGGSSSCFDWYL